jgi:hypothetical protein
MGNNCIEIWKDLLEHNNFQISNFGKIRNKENGKLKPLFIVNEYLTFQIWTNNKGRTFKVHTMVAKYFLESYEKGKDIHHIDGNKLNNNSNNLIVLSKSDHTIIHNTGKVFTEKRKNNISKSKKGKYLNELNPNSKKVYQYTKEGVFIREYKTLKEASIITRIPSAYISTVCTGHQKSAGGFVWSHSNNKPVFYDKYDNGFRVLQFNIEGKFIKRFDSIVEASKSVNRHYSCIRDCCIGKQKSSAGYIWKYEEEIRGFSPELPDKLIEKGTKEDIIKYIEENK